MTNCLPPEQREERYDKIADLTLRGYTAREIAQKLRVTQRLVNRARRRRGVSGAFKSGGRPLSVAEAKWAEAMIDDGASINEIARTLGRNQSTIANRFKGRSQCTSADGARIRRMQQALANLDWDQVRLKETG